MASQKEVADRSDEVLPESVRHAPVKRAVFGVVRETVAQYLTDAVLLDRISEEATNAIDAIIDQRRVVNWIDNADVQNRMRTDVEDELFDVQRKYELPFTLDDIDKLMEESISISRRHKAI